MCVHLCESRPSGVSSSLSESEYVCVLRSWLYPPTSTSACLCDLLQPSASLSGYCDSIHPLFVKGHIMSSTHVHTHMSIFRACLCVCISITVSVSQVIFPKGTLMYHLYCLGVTLSAGSLLYE